MGGLEPVSIVCVPCVMHPNSSVLLTKTFWYLERIVCSLMACSVVRFQDVLSNISTRCGGRGDSFAQVNVSFLGSCVQVIVLAMGTMKSVRPTRGSCGLAFVG